MISLSIKRDLQLFLSILILAGCTSNNQVKIETSHEGSSTIKARYTNGMRNGRTEIYDGSGHLRGIRTYKNDSLSGISIDYFSNGIMSDSLTYVCGKPQGYWAHYYQDGNFRHIAYYYFGLQFGPDIWYRRDDILKSFSFLNFEKEPIVECTYNTHGNLDSIIKMDLKVILTDEEQNGSQLVEFFAYLPKIPFTDDSYSIGIADQNHVKQKLCDIKGSNFLIDTVLSAPPNGYHLYLKCDVKSDDGKLLRTHVVEMIKSENQ